MGVFAVMLNLFQHLPDEYEHLYVTLNQVQGEVSNIMPHYGYPKN